MSLLRQREQAYFSNNEWAEDRHGVGKPLRLYELNSLVRQVIDLQMAESYWVVAELSEVREHHGHCYIELIEKEDSSAVPIARASAKCWRSTWSYLEPHFEYVTGQRLRAGLQVLLQVHAQFHEAYGFSWIIEDIDPNYTLGDMARKRQEILKQLKAEGVLELQKELTLPMFAQRIAVISSATAAGYGDFCNQLAGNSHGFVFNTQLFAATMQGDETEASVIAALNQINEHCDDFDVVVIIRGGGATSDLSGFDTLTLAENVANFPLPIITGIGHDRDESILDLIAYQQVKTPTAAAAFLIEHLANVAQRIENAQKTIVEYVNRHIYTEQLHLERLSRQLPTLFKFAKTRQEAHLNQLTNKLYSATERQIYEQRQYLVGLWQQLPKVIDRHIERQQHRIQLLEQRLWAADPERLLQRGFTITLYEGHSIKPTDHPKPGDKLKTRTAAGLVHSIVCAPPQPEHKKSTKKKALHREI